MVDKKKYDLALDTIEKSNNYLDEVVGDIKNAKKANPKNIDIDPFLQNFNTVTLKHQEILDEIKPKLDKKNKERVDKEIKRLYDIQTNVSNLIKRK